MIQSIVSSCRWLLRLRYKERSNEVFRGTTPINKRKIADSSMNETQFHILNENSYNSPKPPRSPLNASNQDHGDEVFELSNWTTATATSFLSPSMTSFSNDLPSHRVASPLLPPVSVKTNKSILIETYKRQQEHKESMQTTL